VNPLYVSALNCDVPLARPNEFAPLRIGGITVTPPVVLAPMAGVTNPPFRSICREFGAGLYVSEMITARPLGASYMENETQVATIGSINVYAKLGFRYLRSTATFHFRLDGAAPVCV
jgi:hypothetical protein